MQPVEHSGESDFLDSFGSAASRRRVLPWLSFLVGALLLAASWTGAVAIRRAVLDAQRSLNPGGTIPFTLESALAFRRIQQVWRDGALPTYDGGIGWPDVGIFVRGNDTVGEESVVVALCKAPVWPDALSPAERVRWVHLLWWSLSVPALFALVRMSGGGTAGAAAASALWAVAVTAVARSTGQELSHENVAWPLWAWHLVAWAWGARRGWKGWQGVAAGLLGAVLMALALCAWDLMKYWLGFAAIWGVVASWRGKVGRREGACFWLPMWLAMLSVANWNPYHALHGLGATPLTWLFFMVAAASWWKTSPRNRKIGLAVWLCIAAAVGAYDGLAGDNGQYGHFGSLLWAKLRYLNIRPTDPAKLTFEQRILWTPALNSVTPKLLREWLPALGWAGLAGAAWALWRSFRKRADSIDYFENSESIEPAPPFAPFWAAFWLLSFVSFVLFFRFHVWLAWASAVLAGLLFGAVWRGRWWAKLAAVAVAALVLVAETANTLREPVRWGRPNVYGEETAAMLDYLRSNVAPEPVLANFGISGSIAAYGGCPIVLHPKFETQAIRDAVREYLEALFKGNEDAFADWMDARRATVYVHSMGELSGLAPEYSPRFMVDALDPAPDAAVRVFEERPKEARRFKLVFQNRKYRVFRLLGAVGKDQEAEDGARRRRGEKLRLPIVFADIARRNVEAGNDARAWAFALVALRADAEYAPAQELVRELMLREPEDEPYEETDDRWAQLALFDPLPWAPSRSLWGWESAVPEGR